MTQKQRPFYGYFPRQPAKPAPNTTEYFNPQPTINAEDIRLVALPQFDADEPTCRRSVNL